ncbi:MAG: hypothetical protein QOE90_1116 [Thermoplasmata archaeon]|nr:hypothetical protein [Thermoplasmata archaeon]
MLLALALLAPSVAAVPSLPLAPRAGAPGDPGGPGCVPDATGFTCVWLFNDSDQMADPAHLVSAGALPFYELPLPAEAAYPRAYATVRVNFAGEDNGWSVGFVAADANGTHGLGTATHVPDQATSPSHVSTSTHVMEVCAGCRIAFELWPSASEQMRDDRTNDTAPSMGSWRVGVHVEPLPRGVLPPRPAATRDDPQLQTSVHVASEPDREIRAAWLDQAELGSGLFEARLAVGSLAHVDFNHTNAFDFPTNRIDWVLSFSVRGTTYNVTWIARESDMPGLDCGLYAEDGAERLVASVPCAMDVPNATLLARIPERSVGNPLPQDLFTDIRAASYSYPNSPIVERSDALHPGLYDHPTGPVRDAEDQTTAEDMRYAFALGGPDVWHALNPRLDPPVDLVRAWYQAPLAKENLPNTLQVVGALLAGVTFLVGAFAVLARRRQIRRHLDRIDAVERSPAFGSADTLHELGTLEDEFAHQLRRGRLTEAQFQVLSQRIASVASRFALRRELGLVGSAAPPERVVRVPVQDADSSSVP